MSSMAAKTIGAALSAEQLKAMDTWEKIREWSKLPVEVWEKMAVAVGESGLADIITIAMIENQDYQAAAGEFTGVQRARINIAINIARKQFGAEVEDVFVKQAPPQPAASSGNPFLLASSASTLAKTVDEDNGIVRDVIKICQVYDQGCKNKEVRPITEENLTKMRKRWFDVNGEDPISELAMTDNQLSVVFRLINIGHNMLAFDMGVFGPYGGRRERQFAMTASMKNADGVFITKEIPGCQNYEEWEAAWDFATVSFVMGGHIDKGVADAYKAFLKKLAINYAAVWWMVCQADWHMRFEWAVEERRRQQSFHDENPLLSKFDPIRPWNSVLRAAIRGIDSMAFWDDHVKEKARKYEKDRSTGGNQWVARQETSYQGGAPTPPPPPGGGKRALKKARAMARGGAQQQAQHQYQSEPAPLRQRTEEAVRPAHADHKRTDGRFLYDHNGIELCYTWGRCENGCAGICTAEPKRSHGCEWCRGQHRTIHCPSHPNWVPPPKGKGKGKGKNPR